MVIERPIPELRVKVVCDGSTVQVLDGYGRIIEEVEVAAGTYVEISEEVGKMEKSLMEAASAMEQPCE